MLTAARQQEKLANLSFAAGGAAHLPLQDASCDVIWLSQVWHHIANKKAAVHELRRVLRDGGHILVRGTFGDCLDGFPTLFCYWPAARDICQHLPTIEETTDAFASAFVLCAHRRVVQTTCSSLREFATRTKLRADTALALISEADFIAGQAVLEHASANEVVPSPVVETIELLVFRASA